MVQRESTLPLILQRCALSGVTTRRLALIIPVQIVPVPVGQTSWSLARWREENSRLLEQGKRGRLATRATASTRSFPGRTRWRRTSLSTSSKYR